MWQHAILLTSKTFSSVGWKEMLLTRTIIEVVSNVCSLIFSSSLSKDLFVEAWWYSKTLIYLCCRVEENRNIVLSKSFIDLCHNENAKTLNKTDIYKIIQG